MHKLLTNIVTYLKYLNESLNLSTSVHFTDEKLLAFPESVFAMLLPYNVHRNPYCSCVKKTRWEDCICEQEKIMLKCDNPEGTCETCYAGVQEYIQRIFEGTQVVGYIAVSGYRGEIPSKTCPNEVAWREHLCSDPLPMELCKAVIPPLCHMFELLFTYPLNQELRDEYNLILQFLNERHGQVSLADLCERFGRSKSYLSHMFHEKCGMTLPSYCNDLKLNYAQLLLSSTQIPITEIAMDVGYNDVSYFIVCFRKKTGVTPLQYRKLSVSAKEKSPCDD